jgi:methionyl-tRNA formyltransferase
MSKALNVVMLVGKDESSNIMYHALKEDANILKVIVEEPVSKKRLIQNRIKRLGIVTVMGQVLFILLNKMLFKAASKRMSEIKHSNALNDTPVNAGEVMEVESINNDEVIEMLKQLQPDVVVVNGTRIIAKRVLEAVDAPFINTHAGITPKYRGVHGGYWALANDDAAHCGVTIHLVDTGVDTGDILYQEMIHPGEKDSFNTYPLLQLAAAIPLMKKALDDVEKRVLSPKNVDLPSKLWYHPTLWQYIGNYLSRGVK